MILFYHYSACLSVCLSNASTASKRMDISSHFFDILVEASHLVFFLAPPPLQNSKGNPVSGALNKRDGKIPEPLVSVHQPTWLPTLSLL